MPRTRRQEEKLVEKGIPPTPPQQLSTPRRPTKAKAQTPKALAVNNALLPNVLQSSAPRTRARTTSASQSDQPTQTAITKSKPAPKKRGRKTKVSQTADCAVKETAGEIQPVSNASEDSAADDHHVAQTASSRETLSYIPPLSSIPTPHMSAKDLATPDLALPEDVKSRAPPTDPTRIYPDHTKKHSECLTADPSDKLKEVVLTSVPAFLAMLRNHPDINGNIVLEEMLTNGEISVSIKSSVQKSKVRVALQTVEQSLHHHTNGAETQLVVVKSQSKTKRKANQVEEADMENQSPKRRRVTAEQPKRVPVLFDENGMLSLRAYKEVSAKDPTNADEEPTNESARPLHGAFSQNQELMSLSPETPQPRGWTLSGFLPSVTKYLPSFSARGPTVAPAPSKVQPTTPTPVAPILPTTPVQTRNDGPPSQSEPHPIISNSERARRMEHQPAATARTSHRYRSTKSKHGLKTKGEKEEIKKRDEMIASLRAQLDARNELQAQQEAEIEKAAQAQTEIAAQVEAENQKAVHHQTIQGTPKQGTKRKAESPEVIPNPPGGGFGMVLDYFGQDSDDDDDCVDNVQVTPTQSPSKKPRLSGGPAPQIIGNPFRATPYTGTALALPPLPIESFNPHRSFLDEEPVPITLNTPNVGPTMIFRVPSPSDSDDEWDGPSYHESSPDAPAHIQNVFTKDSHGTSLSTDSPQNAAITPKQTLSLSSNLFAGSTASPSKHSEPLFPTRWTGPSSAAALEASKPPAVPNVALDKARQTALKHKPQQPSRLRETSRLSSSTVGNDIDDEDQLPNPNEAGVEGDPYSGQTMRQSPHDPMLLEPVASSHESSPPFFNDPHVSDSSSNDNTTSDPDLPENLASFDSYDEYIKTVSPRVRDFLTAQWSSQDAHEASAIVNQQFSNYEREHSKLAEVAHHGDVDSKVQDYIESHWDDTDDAAAVAQFDTDFETWLEQRS